ncbi:hypothetical protein [Hymenobacter siberiensis]|uniref:hypothetical protein n=1 Tax=Hymenobacter siberiensis TaxID=2848396 RepID=UPI001C1E758D|nr:hypothetical protein [Hymenobacter siberiensis]
MPWLIVSAAVLLGIAATAKAAVDTLTHQAGNNIFEAMGSWWDARTSWKNKYKPGSWEAGHPTPRFWGSTSLFVFVTDFWHFADFIYLTAFLLSGLLCGLAIADSPWWAVPLVVLTYKAAFGAVFELLYQRVFRSK